MKESAAAMVRNSRGTAAVGKLNLLSVAFGVLFIGLGVDFSIHLGMQVRDRTGRGASPADAFVAATRQHGSALALCALTTAIGFLAFVPTPYNGVAQLGVIACGGMLVILVLTFTAFPALLVALHGETGQAKDAGARGLPSGPLALGRHPGLIVLAFAAVTVGALFGLRHVRFDSNVIEMRNQGTESVQAFRDLLATSRTSPWSVDVLARDDGSLSLERTREIIRDLRAASFCLRETNDQLQNFISYAPHTSNAVSIEQGLSRMKSFLRPLLRMSPH